MTDHTASKRRANLISDILSDVCDLPDRTSPDDQPNLLQVETSELTAILENRLPNYSNDTAIAVSLAREALSRVHIKHRSHITIGPFATESYAHIKITCDHWPAVDCWQVAIEAALAAIDAALRGPTCRQGPVQFNSWE